MDRVGLLLGLLLVAASFACGSSINLPSILIPPSLNPIKLTKFTAAASSCIATGSDACSVFSDLLTSDNGAPGACVDPACPLAIAGTGMCISQASFDAFGADSSSSQYVANGLATLATRLNNGCQQLSLNWSSVPFKGNPLVLAAYLNQAFSDCFSNNGSSCLGSLGKSFLTGTSPELKLESCQRDCLGGLFGSEQCLSALSSKYGLAAGENETVAAGYQSYLTTVTGFCSRIGNLTVRFNGSVIYNFGDSYKACTAQAASVCPGLKDILAAAGIPEVVGLVASWFGQLPLSSTFSALDGGDASKWSSICNGTCGDAVSSLSSCIGKLGNGIIPSGLLTDNSSTNVGTFMQQACRTFGSLFGNSTPPPMKGSASCLHMSLAPWTQLLHVFGGLGHT